MRKPGLATGFTLLCAGLLSLPAQAQLEVIFDNGRTWPVAPYLEPLDAGLPEEEPAPVPGLQLGAADVQNLLPVRSPGLGPGPVKTRTQPRSLSRPIFLVGSDPLSIRWLARHRERLQAMQAVGLLVQAQTVDDLQAIAELARGLSIMPASGSDLARVLGLVHYPVLVTSRGIEQ